MKKNISSNKIHHILHESINHVLNETHILNNLGSAWKGAKKGYKSSKAVNNAFDADYDNWWEDDDMSKKANLDSLDNDIMSEFNEIYESARDMLKDFWYDKDWSIECIREDLFYINKALIRIERITNDNMWSLREDKINEWNFLNNVHNGLKGAYSGYQKSSKRNSLKDKIANKKGKYDEYDMSIHKMNLVLLNNVEAIETYSSDFLQKYSNVNDKQKYRMVSNYLTAIRKKFEEVRDNVVDLEELYDEE